MSLIIEKPRDFIYYNNTRSNYFSNIIEPIAKLNNRTSAGRNLQKVIIDAYSFYDLYIGVTDLAIDNVYFLSFDVEELYLSDAIKAPSCNVKATDPQDFTVQLMSSDATVEEVQNLKNFNISVPLNGRVKCQLIFTPNGNYDKIVFSLSRVLSTVAGDLGFEWTDGSSGRRMSIANVTLQKVTNLINSAVPATSFSQIKGIKKFELIAPVGTFFSLDKEEIRVGKTGKYIFDIDDFSPFTFFGIIPPEDAQDDDIRMRFSYEEN